MPSLRRNLFLISVLCGVATATYAQDGYQCVDLKNMSVRYQLTQCPSHLIDRAAWRTSANPSGWTIDSSSVSQTFQPTSVPVHEGLTEKQGEILNKGVGGAIGIAGVLLFCAVLSWVVRTLFRPGKGVAGKTAEFAARASAEEMARAAGAVAGVAERWSRKLREAFNQGRLDKKWPATSN